MTYSYNKYNLGQKVKVYIQGKNWADDCEVEATIIGFGNYFIQGRAVYNLTRDDGVQYLNVLEKDIKSIK